MKKWLRCFIKGHSWDHEAKFSGGEIFECRHCKKKYTSYCYCPGYTAFWDIGLYHSAKPLLDRWGLRRKS